MKKINYHYFLILLSLQISIAGNNPVDSLPHNEMEVSTKKQVFKQYLLNSIPSSLFFGPYSFMFGVTLGGNSIVDGDSPFVANTKWLVTPLLAGFLVQAASHDIKNNILKKPTDVDNSTFYYSIFYIGPDISSIKEFKAEGADGRWSANLAEAEMGIDYPPLGYRTGFSTQRFGMDYEMSLLAHHTLKQTAFYNFNGQIYNKEYNIYVDLPTAMEIDLPAHFLMLHSMFMGINAYYVLPNFGITPYVGGGAGLLLNSVQSQYPGPANLAQEEGSLALDEMEMNWGYHGMVGFRYMKSESFYYLEFRPTFHNFQYNSGTGLLEENDQFMLQSFQFQFGIGTSIF